MTRKEINKFIKEEVKKLPEETYWAYHREIVEENKKEIVVRNPEEHPVRHARRCRTLYKRLGIDGINLFFLRYGFMLKRA